jgi:hypothetical protein
MILFLVFKTEMFKSAVLLINVMVLENRTIIGVAEPIVIIGKTGEKRVIARIDTGAKISSIDAALAEEIGGGDSIRHGIIKSASGTSKRVVVQLKVKIKNRELVGEFSIASRSHMRHPVLIGRNFLSQGFVIIPEEVIE